VSDEGKFEAQSWELRMHEISMNSFDGSFGDAVTARTGFLYAAVRMSLVVSSQYPLFVLRS
jgi:hypothetical protein